MFNLLRRRIEIETILKKSRKEGRRLRFTPNSRVGFLEIPLRLKGSTWNEDPPARGGGPWRSLVSVGGGNEWFGVWVKVWEEKG